MFYVLPHISLLKCKLLYAMMTSPFSCLFQTAITVTISDELTVGEFRHVVLNTLRFVMPDPQVYLSATIDDVEIVGTHVDDIVKNSFRMLRSGMTVDVNILPSASTSVGESLKRKD